MKAFGWVPFNCPFFRRGKIRRLLGDDIALVFSKGLDSISARNFEISSAIRDRAEIALGAHMRTVLAPKWLCPQPVVALICGDRHGGIGREKFEFKDRW